MKNILFALMVLLALPVLAKNLSSIQNLEIQKAVLKEQLLENHILQFEYNRKMTELNGQILQQSNNQLKNQQVNGPGGTASISGVVQVAGLNQADVELALYEVGTRVYAGGAITGALGEYTIADLAAGDYYLLANGYNDDYIDAMWSNSGTEQCGSCQPALENTLTLVDSETRTGVNMDLVVGASISGQVLSGGSPVVNSNVGLWPADGDGNYGNATTDLSGNYTIKGMPTDDYHLFIRLSYDDYIDAQWTSSGTVSCVACQPDPDGLISLMNGDALLGYDFSLTVGATLTGQIVDAGTAAPIETLRVVLYNSEVLNNGYYDTEFDGAGNYTLRGIPEGDYTLYLEPDFGVINDYIPEVYNNIQCNVCNYMVFNGAGDVVSFTNGATTSGINFALEQGASIAGEIRNADYPSETLEQRGLVYIFNVTNRLVATSWIGPLYDPSFDGSYRIGGLLPGTYFVQGGDQGSEFFQRELYNDVRCPWSGCDRGAGGTPVTLGAHEDRTGIDFNLEYGGKISGTVTDASTGMQINSGYETQYVQFYDAAGHVAGGAGINPDGTYTSQRALPPGTYSARTGTMFNAVFNTPYVMEKYMPGSTDTNLDCPGVTCDLTAGNIVVPAYARMVPRDPVAEAAAATVTGIDFALSPAFSFSGTITELGSPTPIPDVHVLVYDDAGNFANWATTDAAGDFTVSGLPAGTYYALTNNGSNLPFMGLRPTEVGSWIDILFDGRPCPGSACDVTTGDPIILGGAPFMDGVSGGPVLDFSLSAGGTINGQVGTFGSALPASNIDINVYNSAGDFYGSYPTDEQGYYLTVGLPVGTYYLTTSNEGALVNAKYGDEYCFVDSCDALDATPVVINGGSSLTDIDFNLRTDYLFKNGMD